MRNHQPANSTALHKPLQVRTTFSSLRSSCFATQRRKKTVSAVASSIELLPVAEVTKEAEVEIPVVEVSPEPTRAEVVVVLALASVVLGVVDMAVLLEELMELVELEELVELVELGSGVVLGAGEAVLVSVLVPSPEPFQTLPSFKRLMVSTCSRPCES